MGWLTCHKDYRKGRALAGLSESKRKKIVDKMDEVVGKYQSDKHLIDAGYANDTETMVWLWRKATGKEFDLRVNDFDVKDARKFNIHRIAMSRDIEKGGRRWFDWFKIPKAITRRFPQLDRFQNTLSDEASFFRSNQIKNNTKITNVIKHWDELAKNHGGDVKKLRKLEYDLAKELEMPETPERLRHIDKLSAEIDLFRASGASKTFRDFHRLMNGLEVEELAKPERGYSTKDMIRWREMDKAIKEIRTDGARILGRGLQKVMQTAKIVDKSEGNYRNLTAVVEKAQDMIRSIEFQKI